MTEFRIGVVAHRTRAATADKLSRRVHADFVSVDTGMLGCEGNHLVVQRHLAGLGAAAWSVVLEDDAVVPADGFRDQLAAALAAAPAGAAGVVSLYLGRLRPPQYQVAIAASIRAATAAGAHWLLGTRLLHAVAYAIRTDLLPSLVDFRTRATVPIDQRITGWARATGAAVAYTWPSLVDHADIPTVIARHPDGQPRPPGRVAWQVGRRDRWTPSSVPLPTS